jgi:hypothetical protein
MRVHWFSLSLCVRVCVREWCGNPFYSLATVVQAPSSSFATSHAPYMCDGLSEPEVTHYTGLMATSASLHSLNTALHEMENAGTAQSATPQFTSCMQCVCVCV